jgi:hypothetical protein
VGSPLIRPRRLVLPSSPFTRRPRSANALAIIFGSRPLQNTSRQVWGEDPPLPITALTVDVAEPVDHRPGIGVRRRGIKSAIAIAF